MRMECICYFHRLSPEHLGPYVGNFWGGLQETRYRQRYLDLMVNSDIRKVFKARSQVISYMRRFLDERDFVEVSTCGLAIYLCHSCCSVKLWNVITVHETLLEFYATDAWMQRISLILVLSLYCCDLFSCSSSMFSFCWCGCCIPADTLD